MRIKLWEGWYFYNNKIHDEAGNSYSQEDIRISWLAGDIVNDNLSNPSNIKIMHQELRHRKMMLTELPTLCLIWQSKSEGTVEKVYSLIEK